MNNIFAAKHNVGSFIRKLRNQMKIKMEGKKVLNFRRDEGRDRKCREFSGNAIVGAFAEGPRERGGGGGGGGETARICINMAVITSRMKGKMENGESRWIEEKRLRGEREKGRCRLYVGRDASARGELQMETAQDLNKYMRLECRL